MTKRDVCVWFCRVWALSGMTSAAFQLLSGILSLRMLGGANAVSGLPSFALYLFVWFFAGGIGTELAAEGEHGPLMTSGAELGRLLLRCAGLWLFLTGAIGFGVSAVWWAYQYFTSSVIPNYSRYITPNLIATFLQSVLGFFLAFTPRIRRFFGK